MTKACGGVGAAIHCKRALKRRMHARAKRPRWKLEKNGKEEEEEEEEVVVVVVMEEEVVMVKEEEEEEEEEENSWT